MTSEMYILMVSQDAGNSYYPDEKAETAPELDARMDQLDEEGLRWFLQDKNGEQDFEYRICRIHKLAIYSVLRSNGEFPHTKEVD